jgi:hypothetical protein
MTAEFAQLPSSDLTEVEKNAHLRMVKYKVLALKEFAKCHVLAGWIRELFLGLLDRQSDDTAADEKSQPTRTQQLPDLQRILASSEKKGLVASKSDVFLPPRSVPTAISETPENQVPSEIVFDQATAQGSTAEGTLSLASIDLSCEYNLGLSQQLGYLTSDGCLGSDMDNMDRMSVGWPGFTNFGDGSGIDELYRHYCNQ